MKTLTELMQDLSVANQAVFAIQKKIDAFDDGFQYMIGTHYHRSLSFRHYKNHWCANDHVSEYYGDNGYVDIYTNNPKFDPDDHGGINRFKWIDTDDLKSAVEALLKAEEDE